MKKFFLTLLVSISVLLAGFSSMAFAADSKIGFIDANKILKEKLGPELEAAEKKVKQLEEDYKKESSKKIQEIEDAKGKLTAQQVEDLQSKYKQELENKRRESQDFVQNKQVEIQELSKQLEKDVKKAIEDVAKEKKLDVVVIKDAVMFGGVDITEDVMKKLKK